MLEFMDYVQAAFYSTSRWDVDNSYASLTATSTHLLDFGIPRGTRVHVSSLASPKYASSYTLGNHGMVDGSLSFLYTSRGLTVPSKSSEVHLSRMVRGYRLLRQLQVPAESQQRDSKSGQAANHKDALLYGRLYLPSSTLEALYLRRVAFTRLLRLSCVSDSSLPSGGTVLALLQSDQGKYSTECLYSTDSSLIGVRALYNFGYDPRSPDHNQNLETSPRHPWDHQNGRLSAGGEAYFSPVNKSGGISTGLRFTTLPVHPGFPYTMTITLNPLMGNLSTSYAVKAGRYLAFCSRFDFNVYSYESDVVVGLELWRKKPPSPDLSWVTRMLRSGWSTPEGDVSGVLKARMSDKGKMGVLYDFRVKDLLVSLGASFDLSKRERMVRSVGLEVSFSS